MHPIRLIRVLRQIFEEHFGGSVNRLTSKLNKPAPTDEGWIKIGLVRGLVSGSKPEHVRLSLAQLQTLDALLAEYGESLAVHPILEQNRPIDVLKRYRRAGTVSFIIGARSDRGEPTSIRLWDALAMNLVLEELGPEEWPPQESQRHYGSSLGNRVGPTKFIHAMAMKGVEKEPKDQKWYEPFKDQEKAHRENAIVCFGSPRASPATEMMLGEMFHTTPFSTGLLTKAPFYFGWGKSELLYPTAFSMRSEDHKKGGKEIAQIVKRCTRFLAVRRPARDLLLPLNNRGHGKQSHPGVVAMQRTKSNKILVVLAGLTGPGTYAAAKMLPEIKKELPWTDIHHSRPVVWGVASQMVAGSTMEGEKCLKGQPKWEVEPEIWSLASEPK